ncbi:MULTISPECIES: ribosome maturation factor RimM [Flectobacillus]|jgi:16S rRNA processing protein RimM|uniref:Ribosome maturation factor RimM n=1 Tax=Flectobacillus roseus TaxID=502259 RepID=A0ABT6Y8D7_9BACT|nr:MULTISPECIES: ribosome maturation factor RimM [Flectobacillus]MDI9859801.1 ribosome maturation factor RimM [Flectobacillus roseus]NBA74489.1 16S rRNA processing protein RimM [Emticicia sp. ODNR4P]PAC31056.1 16S rRNA processing protein RimM [Flectobacillus sp. BAB-3569]
MTKEDCFELGKITKTHGVKGEVILWLDVDFPEDYEEMDSVFLEVRGELVPFFMDSYQLRGNRAIVKFEDCDTFEKAEELLNLQAFLPLEVLPELDGEQFYYHEVIGFQVIDEKLGALGLVQTVYAMQAQDLLVMSYQNKEVLIPVDPEIVLGADKEAQTLQVNLPEGLLDVYLND